MTFCFEELSEMASEEPTLEATETTLEEDAPPLSNAELRLLRLLLTRAAQPQLCRAHTVDFDRLPQPVQVDLSPLLHPFDFDQVGLQRPQRPPQPTLAQELRALFALLRWIAKTLLGVFGATLVYHLAQSLFSRLFRRRRHGA